MACRIRQIFSWLLLLGAIALGLLFALGLLDAPNAAAAIRQLEEAPGQVVYQSRQTLTDQHGHRWQAIAFKRIRPDGSTRFNLRLVGFPDMASIDHGRPLIVASSLGKTWVAMDVSSDIFTDPTQPATHVGQYDLQPLLPDLATGIPLALAIPTTSGESINLAVSPLLVEEWQTLAGEG